MMTADLKSVTVLGAFFALASSCSLIKLSDEVGREKCKNSEQCRNRLDKPSEFNECFEWQCNQHSFCEILPVDRDDDDSIPLYVLKDSCESSGDSGKTAQQCINPEDEGCAECFRDCRLSLEKKGIAVDNVTDCQDSNPRRSGTTEEVCDGIDNDCDEIIDEEVLESDASGKIEVVFSDVAEAGILSSAYAVELIDQKSSRIATAFELDTSPVLPGIAILSSSAQEPVNADLLQPKVEGYDNPSLVSEGIGITSMGDGKFLIAVVDGAGNRRVLVGLSDASKPSQLLIEKSIYEKGLSCAEQEDCSTRTPSTVTPVANLIGRDVLVSYLRGDSLEREKSACGELSDPQPVLVNWVRLQRDVLSEQSDHAVTLGSSLDLSPPALLGIDKIKGDEADSAFGWLVALSNSDRDISILRVVPDQEASTLDVTEDLASIGARGESQGDLSLSMGPLTDEGMIIGVAFRRGCSQDAKIIAKLYELRGEGEDSFVLGSLTDEIEIAAASGVRFPSIAYSEQRDSFVVVYASGLTALQARLLDKEGKLRTESPYTLLESKANARINLPFPSIAVASSTNGVWFTSYIYLRNPDAPEQEMATLKSVDLGCL